MFNFISMNAIRKDFDGAMKKAGYVRAKVICEAWGISSDKFASLLKKGFECDSFIVNGVRYVSVYTQKPEDI